MAILICDRAKDALTAEAIQYTGTAENYREIVAWVGLHQLLASWGRHALVSPDGSQHVFLDVGDWIVRGRGREWDFYVVRAHKMRDVWIPREGSNGA